MPLRTLDTLPPRYPRYRWAYVLLFPLLCACSPEPPGKGTSASTSDSEAAADVVAQVGDDVIRRDEVDAPLQLALHDLAIAAYELRLKKLQALVEARRTAQGGDAQVTWLLEHPQPPRVQIPLADRAIWGNPQAPVKLAVFCSFQSVHCAQARSVYRRLLEEYAGYVALVPLDLPLRYHREARAAAMAARCADAQGARWAYADGLYARAQQLDENQYRQLAMQLELDPSRFSACLQGEVAQGVVRDSALAQELGLRSVPVTFVNGLYIKGVHTFEYFSEWVERELARLGIDGSRAHVDAARFHPSTQGVVDTELPLVLEGTQLSSVAEHSSALIRSKSGSARQYRPGDTVMPGVILQSVAQEAVILAHNNRRERLRLQGRGDDTVSVPLTDTTPRDAETMRRIEQPEGETRRLVPPSGVLPLGQAWLEQQLQNRAELERKFVEAELEVDGHKLLRLEDIADSEFFAALGLEEGDVVVRVNDSWVYSGENQLWDALTSGQVVDVTFMRNGLPQRLQYVVEAKGYFEALPDSGSGGGSGKDAGQKDSVEDDDGSGDEPEDKP